MGSINICIERGAAVPLRQLPPKSIALDGYCRGPEIDIENQRFSCDHHESCVRLFTSATCRQVYDMLMLGFDPNGFNVYVNDVDPDTVLSVWLLQNPDKIESSDVARLVEVAGVIDAHGPAYPIRDKRTAELWKRAMAGLMGLTREAYAKADLAELLASSVAQVDLIFGSPRALPTVAAEYELREGSGWAMAIGPGHLLGQLYEAGHTRVVTLAHLADGSWAVTVAKKSELVTWPVGPGDKPGTILHHLDQFEPGWGGSSTIGGAPRNADGSRSRLSPELIFREIEMNFPAL